MATKRQTFRLYPNKAQERVSKNQWFASITVDVSTIESKFGSRLDLIYESIFAFDLGTETALTLYDGERFTELENPRRSGALAIG